MLSGSCLQIPARDKGAGGVGIAIEAARRCRGREGGTSNTIAEPRSSAFNVQRTANGRLPEPMSMSPSLARLASSLAAFNSRVFRFRSAAAKGARGGGEGAQAQGGEV